MKKNDDDEKSLLKGNKDGKLERFWLCFPRINHPSVRDIYYGPRNNYRILQRTHILHITLKSLTNDLFTKHVPAL